MLYLPKVLTETQIEAIRLANPGVPVRQRPNSYGHLKARCMFETMLLAGLRAQEVCNLRVEDVDLDGPNPMIHVVNGKGGKSRNVPITPKLVDWLRRWMAKRPESEWLFPQHRGPQIGQKMTTRTLRQTISLMGKKVGIKIWPHMLRHTYATTLLARGLSTREVQVLLGHSSVATTEIYTHVDPRALGEKLRQLEECYTADRATTLEMLAERIFELQTMLKQVSNAAPQSSAQVAKQRLEV